MAEYPQLARNTVNRYGKLRGKYDFETIHSIVNSVPVLHVSFPTPEKSDPFVATLPMLGFMGSFSNKSASQSEPLDLYLHGYISSRLMKLGSTSPTEEDGLPVTIAATHLDGLVLALTPNHHSYNYRSAILHGWATSARNACTQDSNRVQWVKRLVTDPDEKIWAMEEITNSVVSDRWNNTRLPPTKTEMTSTQILKVSVIDASAKVRTGGPLDDRADMKNEELRSKTWIGVIPSWVSYGAPVPSPKNRVQKVPEHISSFIKRENESGEKNAVQAIHD